MNQLARRLTVRWIVGGLVGTAVIAATSPLFVRSYIPLTADPIRGVWTLAEGHNFRWRSEGYANTRIGPLGMPGKPGLDDGDKNVIRVALWGDSQAEGVCVADQDKIFAWAERMGDGQIEVLPLARSGEDAADWVTQMPRVERALRIDVHVLLIVDLPDLAEAIHAPVPPPSPSDVAQANAAIAARLPAFLIQTARHLLTEPDGTPRRLRFSMGPVMDVPPASQPASVPQGEMGWQAPLARLRAASQRPIVILYAPKSPQIVAGVVVLEDPDRGRLEAMQARARVAGIPVVDVGPGLREAALDGRWPHGFHHGQIGAGHLNRIGNSVVATELVTAARAAAAGDSTRSGGPGN